MFTHDTQIFLHHTDAAGRLFFANQFYLMHEAKEKMFENLGMSIASMLDDTETTFPLVHAESDYKAVLIAGDRIRVNVWVDKIGETSVNFAYTIFKNNNELAGTGKTVSVAVSKKTGKKTPIPAAWRAALEKQLKK